MNFNVRHTRERKNGPLPLRPSLPKVEGRGGTEGKRFAPSFSPPTSNKIRALFFPALAAAAGDGRFPLFRTYSFPHFSPYVHATAADAFAYYYALYRVLSSSPPPDSITISSHTLACMHTFAVHEGELVRRVKHDLEYVSCCILPTLWRVTEATAI